jgi:site-specific recombinase XerD
MNILDSNLDEFLQYIESQHSPNTKLAYRTGLRKFGEYLKDSHSAVTIDVVTAFASWLNDRVKHDTKANYLIAVGLFYRWCVGKRILNFDTAEMEQLREFLKSAAKRTEHLPRLPDDEMIDALCHAARSVEVTPSKNTDTNRRNELERLRNIALIESLRSSGMRVGELVGLRIGDVDRTNHSARVTGKGDKQRNVFFNGEAWSALIDYWNARGTLNTETTPVFSRHNAMTSRRLIALPITTDTVRDVLKSLCEIAKLDVAVTPHWLRHWFATKVLESTDNLAIVQDMLGHSSPATTRIYAKVSLAKMRAAHRKTFEKSG